MSVSLSTAICDCVTDGIQLNSLRDPVLKLTQRTTWPLCVYFDSFLGSHNVGIVKVTLFWCGSSWIIGWVSIKIKNKWFIFVRIFTRLFSLPVQKYCFLRYFESSRMIKRRLSQTCMFLNSQKTQIVYILIDHHCNGYLEMNNLKKYGRNAAMDDVGLE